MRRVGRWLVNALAGVSLLLCIALVALWVRSYWHGDTLLKYSGPNAYAISSGRGGICYEHTTMQWLFSNTRWRWLSDSRPLDPRKLTKHWWHGFGYRSIAIDKGWDRTYVAPDWALVAFSGLLPVICALGLRKGRRADERMCPSCAYDLTGNTSGVCPECGMPVAGKAGA